jgi:hypothetical protein
MGLGGDARGERLKEDFEKAVDGVGKVTKLEVTKLVVL